MADPDDLVRMTLRLPNELHEHLDREANRRKRSLNGEIVKRLRDSIQIENLQMITRMDNEREVMLRSEMVKVREMRNKKMEELEEYSFRLAAMEADLDQILRDRSNNTARNR